MSMHACPFCKEKIYPAAIVCRYCRRDLPESKSPRGGSGIWIAAITASAVIISGAALLAMEYFRERRNWLE